MRIVQIGSYPLSRDCVRGGVEASVFGLAQEQARNMEVHVFDIPRIGGKSNMDLDGKVIVHRFCNAGKRQVSASRRVKAMAAEIGVLQPDVCHLHGTGLFSWLMYRRLKRMDLNVVVTIHGLVLVEKWNMLKKGITPKRVLQYVYQGMVEKCFLTRLPVAIVDTEYVKEMVNRYPIRKKPLMQVIPQGVNKDFFRIHCSQVPRSLLSVGAIGERKGQLLTLEAFECVRKTGVDCSLILVGTVASQAYYKRLCEAIEKSEYRDDINLCIDVTGEELKAMYENAHVFVLHTEEESQGMVFAEAMATGMPIIGTNVGGVPCVVENGKNGLLSNYGDVNAFAKNIQCLMTSEALWQNMSKASVKAADNYHWTKIGERILQLYKECVLC